MSPCVKLLETIVGQTQGGSPIYVRDLFEVHHRERVRRGVELERGGLRPRRREQRAAGEKSEELASAGRESHGREYILNQCLAPRYGAIASSSSS
jgi:hypothetical protein